MHPNHLNFDDWDSHALFSAFSNLFSVLHSARLPVFFLKDVSLLQMIGDFRAALLRLSDRWGRKNLSARARTCIRRVCVSWLRGPCNHLSNLQGEFYQVHPRSIFADLSARINLK